MYIHVACVTDGTTVAIGLLVNTLGSHLKLLYLRYDLARYILYLSIKKDSICAMYMHYRHRTLLVTSMKQ